MFWQMIRCGLFVFSCILGTFSPTGNITSAQIVTPDLNVTFEPNTVRLGGSFTTRFSGTNLTPDTYFDIRFRPPGSSVDEVAHNWQQGTSSAHTIATSLSPGTWTVTGVRAHQNLADHSGDFFPVSGTLTVVLRSRASATTEYYASPTGGGSGLSEQDPFQIADAWSVIRPGDTLWLLDGVYTGNDSMIHPSAGVAGTADARIAIRARNDGQVLIDGQGSQNRVVWLDYTNGNDYFTIEGINATAGLNYVIDSSATGNIFRRCIAWNAIESDEGEQTWRSNGYHGLVEDCVAFGGRYALGGNQMGNDAPSGPMTTFRRCIAVFSEATDASPKASVVYWYNSDPIRWENCIALWNCKVAPNSQGMFYCATADPYVHGAQQTEVLGSLALLNATADAPDAVSGMSSQGNRRITFDNCLSAMSPMNLARNLLPFDLRAASTTQGGAKDLYIKNSTGIGANESNIHPDWIQSNVKSGTSISAVYGSQSLWVNDGTKGATICKRYVDGVLTDQGLFPWPMNQRLIDLLVSLGYPPVDVTASLEAAFGTIPAACRWDATPEPPAPATLTATPSTVAPGGTVTLSWSSIAKPTRLDWIGGYVPGAPDWTYGTAFIYTSSCSPTAGAAALASGSCTITMPTTPGTYEFRLFANDATNLLAKSGLVEVAAPPAAATLTANLSTVAPGGTVTLSWSSIANPTRLDWIGGYNQGASIYSAFIYTSSCSPTAGAAALASGSCTITMPTTPGTYEFRLFANDTTNLLAKSGLVEVAPPAAATLTATPSTVAPGGTVTLSWSSIAKPTKLDWIGGYVPGTPDWEYGAAYIYTSSCSPTAGAAALASGSCTITMPTTPGTYEFRLFANDATNLLAKSGLVKVAPQ